MAPRRNMITLMTALLCIMLGILSLAPAARGAYKTKTCCTTYNRKPMPFRSVIGYREQTAGEYCRIDAIIFFTVKQREVCATRKDEWVRKLLELLSSKLKKMSKTRPAAGENEKPSAHDRSGSSFTTDKAFFNSTAHFY